MRKIGINALLFAILFLSISFNKDYLRPFFGEEGIIGVILGCLPNFLAAGIIPLAAIHLSLKKDSRIGRTIFYAAALLVFIILAIEEFYPMWGASETFDVYDILASGLGAIAAILTYEAILFSKETKVQSSDQ